MYARILIPIDGTACSDNAVAHGLALAKATGSYVEFLFAMDTLSARQEGVVNMAEARLALLERGRMVLARAERTATCAGIRSTGELVEDAAADAIVDRSANFDLVVMSSHGKGILKRLTVGSVTQAVLHRVMRPVLVVRCIPEGENKDSAP
jgi:nucleotide-binding universal stress UspA family protein